MNLRNVSKYNWASQTETWEDLHKGADDFSFFYSANFGGGDYCLFLFSKPKKLESEVSLSFWVLI